LRRLTALVTGSSGPAYGDIIRALKSSTKYRIDVVGSDCREFLSSKYYTKRNFLLPDNGNPGYASALLDLCIKQKVDVVLPTQTGDQLPICERLGEFRDADVEPTLMVTDPFLFDILLNRRKLLEYCKEIVHIETPDHFYANTRECLGMAVQKLGYPEKPVVIKPSSAIDNRGTRILNEHVDVKRQFLSEKPDSTYSTLDRVLSTIGDSFPEMLAIEYLPGREYLLDVLCRKGKTFAVIPELLTRNTEGVATGGLVSKDANFDSLAKLAESVIEGFGLSYGVTVHVKENASGIPSILGIDPGLQDNTALSVAAGVNVPELMVMMAVREFDYAYSPKIAWGLKMQRVWREVFEYGGRIWTNYA